MKKIACFFLSCLLVTNTFLLEAVWADKMKYGKINVISEVSGANIYIDGEMRGTDVVNLSQIPAGSHYVKVMDSQSKVLFNEVVTVEEGKVVTIVAKPTDQETKNIDREEDRQKTVSPQYIQTDRPDYGQGFTTGKSEGYQKGMNDGIHQARINKAWAGWAIWIVFVLLVFSAPR